MSNYILINEQFAQANENYSVQNSHFGYGQTTSGHYVCAEQTLIEMPELFQNDIYLDGIVTIELDVTDFPQTPVV